MSKHKSPTPVVKEWISNPLNQMNWLYTGRSAAWVGKWWWPWQYVWDKFKSPCVALKSKRNILRSAWKHWRNNSHFQQFICKVGFAAITMRKTRLWGKLNISNTLWISLSPIKGSPNCKKKCLDLPLFLHYGEVCNDFLSYHNEIIIEIKCNQYNEVESSQMLI